jgi:hypothetical protein
MAVTLERRIVGFIGGIVVTVAALYLALVASGFLATVINHQPTGAPGTNVQGGELGYTYYLSFAGFALATGALFVVLTWNRAVGTWKRALLYSIAVVVLLLLSGANFVNRDSLVAHHIQAIVNLVLAFVSGVVVLSLMRARMATPEATVFRLGAIALLSSLGIALPLLFSVLWFLARLHMTVTVPSEVLAMFAAFIGLATAVLEMRLKAKQLNDARAGA